MQNTLKHDYTWIDALRVLSCFLVVLAHCCDPFVSSSSNEEFISGAIWGTFYRPCVPLFIMISGVLLLPTSLKIGEFYKKRLKRIIVPFIFWSILSPVLFYLFISTTNTVNPCVSAENHTLSATLTAMYTWIFNFSYSTIPYWYVYMMLGVYLVIPLISDWVKNASQKDLRLVLYIWLFTTIIPYIEIVAPYLGYKGNYGSMGVYGVCSWNLFSTFHYLAGFLGYALLAHYFVKFPLNWDWKKTAVVCSAMWLAGYFISYEGFMFTKETFPDDFNKLEIIWSFTSINVVMMTLPFFLVFQKIKFKPSKCLSKVAESTYGVFLCHFVVVHIFYELYYQNLETHSIILIPLIALTSFAVCSLIISTLRKIPLFRKIS